MLFAPVDSSSKFEKPPDESRHNLPLSRKLRRDRTRLVGGLASWIAASLSRTTGIGRWRVLLEIVVCICLPRAVHQAGEKCGTG